MNVGSETRCILSEEGVQQGDPLGPCLFVLALQPILASSCSSSDSVLTPTYLDDVTVVGSRDEAIKCYKLLKANMHDIGLDLREENCEAFSFSAIPDWNLPVSIKSDGFTILGTPIGHTSFVKKKVFRSSQSSQVIFVSAAQTE